MHTELTRRTLLAGTAMAASASALGLGASLAARAQTSAPLQQAPGFYRYRVGDIVVTQINDGQRTFPLPDNFVRNQNKETVSKALEAAYLPGDQMTIAFNPMVVSTGGKLVLIDTGNGPQKQPNAMVGLTLRNMQAAGIDPKAIDIVIISHFHGDHINGLRAADGSLAFPNAEIKVPAAEWAFWMSDENMNKVPEAAQGNFKNVRRVFANAGDRITRFEPDKEVAPGITSIATVGHTPGHNSFVIASGNRRLMVSADVTNRPELFLRHPGWHVQFDMNAQQAEDTRRKFYDMVVAEKLPVAGFHFPFPALGHVEKEGDGYQLVPIAWSPVV
jgi:glyoxylase-like metal-dependent hydrolase (beta-lactamase superfamily II)